MKEKVSWDFVAIVLLSCEFEFHIYSYCMGPGQKTSHLKININAEPLHRETLVWLYGIPIAIDNSPLMLSSLLKVIKKNWQCIKQKPERQETAQLNSQELWKVELLNNKYLVLIIKNLIIKLTLK